MRSNDEDEDQAVVDRETSSIDQLFSSVAIGNGDGAPLYKAVERYLRDLITSGKLVPGDLIPAEPQLASALNVSQGTVKKAIDNLVVERLLYRHQGKGTYVSRINFDNSLFRFFSYGGAAGEGVRIHKETIKRELQRGKKEICRHLELPGNSKLVYIERIGLIEVTPILVEYSWLPASLVPGLEKEEVHIPDLMYAVVVEKFGVPVVRSEETLTAEIADEKIAKTLDISAGAPIVALTRRTFTTENRILEFRQTKGRADRFSYKTEIR